VPWLRIIYSGADGGVLSEKRKVRVRYASISVSKRRLLFGRDSRPLSSSDGVNQDGSLLQKASISCFDAGGCNGGNYTGASVVFG
jgi:hypothetical protein